MWNCQREGGSIWKCNGVHILVRLGFFLINPFFIASLFIVIIAF